MGRGRWFSGSGATGGSLVCEPLENRLLLNSQPLLTLLPDEPDDCAANDPMIIGVDESGGLAEGVILPGQAAVYSLSGAQEANIVAGLAVLETAWNNLSTVDDLTDAVDLLGGASLGGLFDLDAQLNGGLITPSEAYFAGEANPTLEGWVDYLIAANTARATGDLSAVISNVSIPAFDPGATNVWAEFDFDVAFDIYDKTMDLSTYFEDANFDGLGFSLTVDDLVVDVDATIDLTVRLGVDSAIANGFYVAPSNFTVGTAFSADTSVSVQAGMFGMSTGTVSGTGPSLTVSLVDPNTTAGTASKICVEELNATALGDLFTASISGSGATINMPLDLNDATLDFTQNVGLSFQAANAVADSTFSLTGTNLGDMVRLVCFDPQTFVNGLHRLGQSFETIKTLPMMDVELPLTGGTEVGDIVDFAEGINSGISDQLYNLVEVVYPHGTEDEPQPTFSSWTQLLTAMAGYYTGIDFDDVTRKLEFDLDYSYDFTAFDVGLDLAIDLTPLELSSATQLTLAGSADYTMTLGVEFGAPEQLVLVAGQETVATENPASPSLNGQIATNAIFNVNLNGWDSYTVTLTAASTIGNSSLLDLVADLNTAIAAAGAGAELEAVLVNYSVFGRVVTGADTGDPLYDGTGRIGFRTLDSDEWGLQVEVLNTNSAYTALGFATDDTTTPGLATMYVDDVTLGASVALTAADASATGSLGIVSLTVEDGSASITGTASGELTHPDTSATKITVAQLSQLQHRWSEMITLNLAGTGQVSFDTIQVSGLGGLSFGVDPQVDINIADITDSDSITVTCTDFGNLFNARTMTVSTVLGALAEGVEFLSSMEQLSFINFTIPVLNRSVAETLTLAQSFTQSAEDAENTADSGGSLQLLGTDLDAVFDMGGQGSATLGLDGTNLQMTLTYTIETAQSYAFSLDLSSMLSMVAGDTSAFDMITHLIDVQGSSTLALEAYANVTFSVGIDMSDVNDLDAFMYDTSSISLGLKATASDIDFSFAAGPLNMYIKGGTVALDKDGNINTDDYMLLAVAVTNGDGNGKHYFGDVDEPILADLTCTMTAAAQVSLPIYFPSDSVPLGGAGNNIFTMTISDLRNVPQSTANSITIAAPDFSNLFTGLTIIQVLNDPGLVIDGIQASFDIAEQSVQAMVSNIDLPLVGTYLTSGVEFVGDMGDSLLTYIRTTLNEVLDGSQPTTLIQSALFSAFGPAGLDILKDSTSDSQVTVDDVVMTLDEVAWQYVEYNMDLGQDIFSADMAFDLGIGVLPLSLDGEVRAQMGWTWDLGLGIHVVDGFYLMDQNDSELSINLDVLMPQTLTGSLFILQADVTPLDESGDTDYTRSLLNGAFSVNFTDPSGEGRIGTAELRGSAVADLITASFAGGLDADLEVIFSLGGASQFPRIRTELDLTWTYNKTFGGAAVSTSPTIAFAAVEMDLGSLVSGFLEPVFGKIDEVIDPVRPVLTFLTTDLPVIGLAPTEIATAFGYGSYAQFITAADWIATMAADVAAMPEGQMWMPMGSFNVASGDGAVQPQSTPDLTTSLNGSGAAPSTKTFMQNAKTGNASFALSILEPANIFGLIMGQDVNLVTFAIPDFQLQAGYSQYFPIFGPLGMRLGGALTTTVHLGFGYDTYGIRRAFETENYAYIMDGLYVSDRANADGTGADISEVTVGLDFYAAGELNAVIASGGVRGGVYGEIGINLNDPDNDGKVRMSELTGNMLAGVDKIVDVSALIEAYLNWYVKIGVGCFSKTFGGTLANVTLYQQTWLASNTPVLVSTAGSDELVLNMGDFSDDRLHGNKSGGAESFVLSNSGGNLLVSFGGQSQTIAYSPGDTVLIEAGNGDDNVVIGAGLNINVVFDGGSGNDRIEMLGNGILQASGGPGNDVLIGGGLNDILDGGDGNDTLQGGDGSDSLTGGLGNDVLEGGSGNDTYLFGDSFGDDTVTDSSGAADLIDFSSGSSPVTLNTLTKRVDNAAGDSVIMNAILETVTGSTGSDTVLSRNEANSWNVSAGNTGTYNGEFTFTSFERLIGNTNDDTFVFADGAYVSDYIDGGSGAEDIVDANYITRTTTDVLDLSAYTTSNRWQVSSIDGGRLFLANGSPLFSGIESHNGGQVRDYLVLSDDVYISGLFDGNAGNDRVDISDYKLTDVYKTNVWDITGHNSGSLNERSAYIECENFTGGENKDVFFLYPNGTYAQGFLFTPGGTGGTLDGAIDALGEDDTIDNSPPYRDPETGIPLAGITYQDIFGEPVAPGAITAETRIDPNDYDVRWNITGANSGTRTAGGDTVVFTSTQNLEGSADADLFVIYPGGSLDGYINGHGGHDALVYGWDADVWNTAVSVDFSTTDKASATAIGGYVENIEDFVSGTNTGDTLTGADVANVWNITASNTGQVGAGVIIDFQGFENIVGGNGADEFIFAAGAAVSGSVGGGDGTDSIDLSTYASPVSWAVTAVNGGTVSLNGAAAIPFTSIEEFSGSTAADSFVVSGSGKLTGTVAGNGGTDTLNYSAISSGLTWTLLETGAGSLRHSNSIMNFEGVESILSGTGNDMVLFTEGVDFGGVINGGTGTDTFDYSDYSVASAVSVNLQALTASGVSTFAAVEQFIGGSSAQNTLTAKDGVTNAWTISDWDDGQIVSQSNTYTFYDFPILQGGSGADNFTFNDLKYVRGPIDGGGGNDSLSCDGYSLTQQWTITGTGAGRLTMTGTSDPVSMSFTSIENITTGDADNTIYIRSGGSLTSLVGGDSTDVLDLAQYGVAVTVNLDQQTLGPVPTFSNIDSFVGSALVDTLVGWNSQTNAWQITGANAGTVTGSTSGTCTFSGFENLTGGNYDDAFTFADGATLSGALAGAGSHSAGNSLSLAAYTTAVEVNLQAGTATAVGGLCSGIGTFIGGASTEDRLVGRDGQTNNWSITATDSGTINTNETIFSGFEHLTGGSQADTFALAAGAAVTGTADGAGGTNTLNYSNYGAAITFDLADATATGLGGYANIDILLGSGTADDVVAGPAAVTQWTITAANAGTVGGLLTFSGIEQITGNSLADTFTFAAGASLDGSLSGGGGWDILNCALQTGALVLDLQQQTFSLSGATSGIEEYVAGASTSDSIVGDDQQHTWVITADNTGHLDSAEQLRFSGFENLTGGAESDTFELADGVGVAGDIDGGQGADTLDMSAYSAGLTVNITATDAGTAGDQGFTGVENLIGTQADDTLHMADAATLTGTFAAQAGSDTLDYSLYSTAVVCDLVNGTVTGLAGYGSVESFVGGLTSDDQLIGTDQAATWNLTSDDSGNWNEQVTFASFENLTGGALADTFLLNDGVGVTGTIDGQDGTDTLDYSLYSTDVDIDLTAMTATGVGGMVDIEVFMAGAGTNTLTGSDQANTWDITANDAGTLNDAIQFADFGSLYGGPLRDEFRFSDATIVSDSINGGAGIDMLDFTDYTTVNTWRRIDEQTVQVDTVYGSFNYTSIENYSGSSSVFLFPNFDLKAEFVNLALPSVIVPGETIASTVRVTNLGNALLEHTVDIEVYASLDDQLDTEDDTLLGNLDDTMLRIAQNRWSDLSVSLLFPQDMSFDDYHLIIQVDAANDISEADEQNNTYVTPSAQTVGQSFGNLDVQRNVPLQLTLGDGSVVEMSLRGNGYGQVDGLLEGIQLFDTDSQTQLEIKIVSGADSVPLGDVNVIGSLSSLVASDCDLQGNITISGSLKTLRLHDTLAGVTNTITIGAGTGSLSVYANSLTDAALQSQMPVSTFQVGQWADTDDQPDTLTAPSITSLTVNGPCAAQINITSAVNTARLNGAFTGTLNANSISMIQLAQGLAGAVNTTAGISQCLVTGDLAGSLDVGADVTFLRADTITGVVRVGETIRSATVNGDLAGQVFSSGDINSLIINGGDLTGQLGTNTKVNSVFVLAKQGHGGAITGVIDTGDEIGTLYATAHSSGSIETAMIRTLLLNGGFSGSIIADGTVDEFPQLAYRDNIGLVSVSGEFSGTIDAGQLNLLLVRNGSLSGAVTLTDNLNLLFVQSGDFTGTITAQQVGRVIVSMGLDNGTINLIG